MHFGVNEAAPEVNVRPLNSIGTQLPVDPVVTKVTPLAPLPDIAAQQNPLLALQASVVVLFVHGLV